MNQTNSTFNRIKRLQLFFLATVATLTPYLHAAENDINRKRTDDICYQGFLPKFHKNLQKGKIWYLEYTISAAKGFCEKVDRLKPSYRFVELLSGETEVIKTDSGKRNLARKIFSDPIVIPAEGHSSLNDFRYLTNRLLVNPFTERVHYPQISIETPPEEFNGLIQNKAEFAITSRPSRPNPGDTELVSAGQTDSANRNYVINQGNNGNKTSPAKFKYLFAEDIFYSSNGCWLIVPHTHLVRKVSPVYPKNYQVYALSGMMEAEPSNGICSPSGYWPNTRANIARSRGKALPKATHFELQDFHKLNKPNSLNNGIFRQDNLKNDKDRHIKPALLENNSFYNLDFTAYSQKHSQLDVVYQVGFLSNHNNKNFSDTKLSSLLEKEKYLSGDLEYLSFEVKKHTSGAFNPFVDVRTEDASEVRLNITEKCDHLFTGWESAPKLSADKSHLFFLAQDDVGDDSSRTNLYVADFTKIKNLKFDCTNPDHIKNLTRNLRLKPGNVDLQYPILGYSVSPDQQKITILFEIEGQTVVHFFRFNNNSKRIVHMYPQSISGLGKIYDFVVQDYATSNTGESIIYVMHSRLNMPARISRCYQRFSRFVCGNPDAPIATTSFGDTLISNKNKPGQISVSVETTLFSTGCASGVTVPGFLLRPSIPNGKAIVSIHGGPNEAWDGRFSQTDFVLAKTGYTVYMPNPSGSTGYGWAHTKAGHREWGTTIYNDIECTINHVKEYKEGFEKLFLMGFSFGGYIANWIQTKPNDQIKNKVEAMIALSPLFDLQTFARTTDQFWFPQFQLGCSGESCPSKKDFQCGIDLNQCAHPNTLPVFGQNPACYLDCETNKIKINPIPMLIISPQYDIRIPLSSIFDMLDAYQEKGVPFTYKKELGQGHGFMPYTRIAHGKLVHDWIESLYRNNCKKDDTWDPDCEAKETNTPVFDTNKNKGPWSTNNIQLIRQGDTLTTPPFLLNLYP